MKKLLNEELNRLTVDEFKKAAKYPVVLILDNVRSLNNIGSIFRSCDAFLAERIILCGITAVPPHREISKTALGATESVDWKYMESSVEAVLELKSEGYKVFAVEQAENSISLESFELSKNEKYAVIFGHEVRGVEQEVINHCHGVIEIPQYGTKHSLNVAVSAGIVLWQMVNALRPPIPKKKGSHRLP